MVNEKHRLANIKLRCGIRRELPLISFLWAWVVAKGMVGGHYENNLKKVFSRPICILDIPYVSQIHDIKNIVCFPSWLYGQKYETNAPPPTLSTASVT